MSYAKPQGALRIDTVGREVSENVFTGHDNTIRSAKHLVSGYIY